MDELERLRKHAEASDGCLLMVRECLEKLGCRHGLGTHESTPPMMYPEWIHCVLRSHLATAEKWAGVPEALRSYRDYFGFGEDGNRKVLEFKRLQPLQPVKVRLASVHVALHPDGSGSVVHELYCFATQNYIKHCLPWRDVDELLQLLASRPIYFFGDGSVDVSR